MVQYRASAKSASNASCYVEAGNGAARSVENDGNDEGCKRALNEVVGDAAAKRTKGDASASHSEVASVGAEHTTSYSDSVSVVYARSSQKEFLGVIGQGAGQ